MSGKAKAKGSLKRTRGEVNEGKKGLSDESEDEVAFWKNNYYEMKKLKDEAEEDLQAEKKLRTNKEDILKEGLDLLNKKQTDDENGVQLSPDKKNTSHSNEHLQKIIDFYESMTAMTVKLKEGDKYRCTIKNPTTRKVARFFISKSDVEGELLYEPSANSSLFPEYMNEEALSFVPEMGPVLLGDAIASLFVEDESGDEEEAEKE